MVRPASTPDSSSVQPDFGDCYEPPLLVPIHGQPRLVADSQAMREVMARIERVAGAHCPVLITGETGAGKEVVAREVHRRSSRSGAPFVPVNCGGLPEGLQFSQLFGHRAGAFTGAVKQQLGLVEAANRGTLFLDEVGDLPLSVQLMLLRFLQDGEFLPAGETRVRHCDARVLAATDQDLGELMHGGNFRHQLFYRLGMTRIHVPPLRERREDMAGLVDQLLKSDLTSAHSPVPRLAGGVLEKLQGHSWPGNVRELRGVLTRACMECHGGVITTDDVIFEEPKNQRNTHIAQTPRLRTFSDAEREFQWTYFNDLLRLASGSVKEAARLAGLSERGLRKRLEALGLNPGPFRPSK